MIIMLSIKLNWIFQNGSRVSRYVYDLTQLLGFICMQINKCDHVDMLYSFLLGRNT